MRAIGTSPRATPYGSAMKASVQNTQVAIKTVAVLSALPPLPLPRRFGHRSERRLAVGPGEQVRNHALGHGPTGPDRRRADMRQEHRVLERNELLRHAGLVLEHVEPRGQNRLVAQRLDQRLLVDQGAARNIDQYAIGAERL